MQVLTFGPGLFDERKGMSEIVYDFIKITCIWNDSQHSPVSASLRFSGVTNSSQFSGLKNFPYLRDKQKLRTEKGVVEILAGILFALISN
jgi:hypothetical protein